MWITPTSVCTQFVLLNAELLTENWKHIIPILQNILKVVKVLLLIWSWRTLAKSFILNYTCTCVELTVYTPQQLFMHKWWNFLYRVHGIYVLYVRSVKEKKTTYLLILQEDFILTLTNVSLRASLLCSEPGQN